mgnify:CR=1 FL=1
MIVYLFWFLVPCAFFFLSLSLSSSFSSSNSVWFSSYFPVFFPNAPVAEVRYTRYESFSLKLNSHYIVFSYLLIFRHLKMSSRWREKNWNVTVLREKKIIKHYLSYPGITKFSMFNLIYLRVIYNIYIETLCKSLWSPRCYNILLPYVKIVVQKAKKKKNDLI